MLQDILTERSPEALKWWCARAGRSQLEPFCKLAKTVRNHWDGIIGYFQSGLTTQLHLLSSYGLSQSSSSQRQTSKPLTHLKQRGPIICPQSKGGIGKSTAAIFTSQYLTHIQAAHQFYDLDDSNRPAHAMLPSAQFLAIQTADDIDKLLRVAS